MDYKYMLGTNYWGRRWGTEMWLHYDGKEVREELRQLHEYGVRCLRVFPNWRDFQPVERAYAWQGTHGEYLNARTGEPVYDDGVDADRIAEFRDFCRAAEETGIELVVSIVTGWMSGRLFTPPVLNGKNLISDPEAIMWMTRCAARKRPSRPRWMKSASPASVSAAPPVLQAKRRTRRNSSRSSA